MKFEPYKFNDNAANQAPLKLGKQFAKLILKRAAAERNDPNSLQNRVNARLDEAAKNAAAINKANAKNKEIADAATAKAAAKAAIDKKNRAAATRRATAAHKVKLARAEEFENLKTRKQVERAKLLQSAKERSSTPPPAEQPPKKPRTAARNIGPGMSTDKDGVLKPIVSSKKDKGTSKSAGAPRPKVNTAAGDLYND
jgi:hypothetical protein